jgi:hypothetical protein
VAASDPVRLLGAAGVLGSITVFVYRLGVWRQEMDNMGKNLAAELRAHRAESEASFERIEARLEQLEENRH